MCRPGGRIVYQPPVTVPHNQYKPKPTQHSCPLTGVEAHVIIKDFCASIALSQQFQNIEEHPIEAVYQFPLNEKNCICDFTAEIDGKVIKGECKEKEEAKDIYEDAISSGHGAYLLEEDDDPNIFKVSVGNLPPGKEVKITITYVAELEFVEGVLQWILPTSKEEEGPASPYYRSATSKVALPGLKLKVDLDMTSNIRSLSSPSHPISFEFGEEPTKAQVALGDSSEVVTKDFVLNVKLAKPHQPCGKVQKDKKGNLAAMVALYPEIKLEDDEEIYTECVFLIDRSGSMAGTRINQVRDTMQIFLRSIGEGTMFNIVGFGTRPEFLFKNGSVEYNDTNLDIATKHIAGLSANLGGTNILTPLQEILKAPAVEGYPRQLFILTDGEVSNTQACIDYVRKNSHTTRVFTFGIGNEASQDLVKGMAKAGEGFFEFILPGENMEEKVMKQLGRAMQPALTDISVDWGELVAEQAPFRLPPLFLGGRLVVYGFLPEGSKETKVTLRAKTAIKEFETSVDVKPQDAVEGTLFHQLGAKQLIRDLQEGRSFMHNVDGSLMQGRNAEKVKTEMIRLSTSYGVLCPHTAFVAVEERDEATEGTMQVRKIGVDTEAPKEKDKEPTSPTFSSKKSGGFLGLDRLRKKGKSEGKKDKAVGGGSMPRTVNKPVTSAPSRGASNGAAFARRSSSVSTATTPTSTSSVPLPARSAPSPRSPRCAPAPSPKMMSSSSSSFSAGPPPAPPSASSWGPPPPPLSRGPPPPGGPPPPSPSFGAAPPPPPGGGRGGGGGAGRGGAPPRPSSPMAPPPQQSLQLRQQQSQQQPQQSPQLQQTGPGSEMRTLIMKQKASGSWTLGEVSNLLGSSLSPEAIKKAIAVVVDGDASADVEAIWVTAIVIAFLEARFPDQKTNWDLVVKKAKRWIAKQVKTVQLKSGVDVVSEAAKFVAAN